MTNRANRKTSGLRGSRSAPPTNAFPLGTSGNQAGRPKSDPELVEAFRARTPQALAVLAKVQDDYLRGEYVDEEGHLCVPPKPGEAVKAAEVWLNRGWGTAPTTVKLDATVRADVAHEVKPLAVQTPERLRRVADVLQRSGVLDALNAAKSDAE